MKKTIVSTIIGLNLVIISSSLAMTPLKLHIPQEHLGETRYDLDPPQTGLPKGPRMAEESLGTSETQCDDCTQKLNQIPCKAIGGYAACGVCVSGTVTGTFCLIKDPTVVACCVGLPSAFGPLGQLGFGIGGIATALKNLPLIRTSWVKFFWYGFEKEKWQTWQEVQKQFKENEINFESSVAEEIRRLIDLIRQSSFKKEISENFQTLERIKLLLKLDLKIKPVLKILKTKPNLNQEVQSILDLVKTEDQAKVINFIKNVLSASVASEEDKNDHRRMLLVGGSPGIGRKRFVKKLGSLLSLNINSFNFNRLSNDDLEGVQMNANNFSESIKKSFLTAHFLNSKFKNDLLFLNHVSLDKSSETESKIEFFKKLVQKNESLIISDKGMNISLDGSHLVMVAAIDESVINPQLDQLFSDYKIELKPLSQPQKIEISLEILEKLKETHSGIKGTAISNEDINYIDSIVERDDSPGVRNLRLLIREYVNNLVLRNEFDDSSFQLLTSRGRAPHRSGLDSGAGTGLSGSLQADTPSTESLVDRDDQYKKDSPKSIILELEQSGSGIEEVLTSTRPSIIFDRIPLSRLSRYQEFVPPGFTNSRKGSRNE